METGAHELIYFSLPYIVSLRSNSFIVMFYDIKPYIEPGREQFMYFPVFLYFSLSLSHDLNSMVCFQVSPQSLMQS